MTDVIGFHPKIPHAVALTALENAPDARKINRFPQKNFERWQNLFYNRRYRVRR